MTSFAAILALAALVASGAGHRPASGATVSNLQPGSGAQVIGFDAWFNDRGSAAGAPAGGVDAWFNDPVSIARPALGYDAWFEDSAGPASPASFDAWFNDR